jgi:hypothetical protein
MFKLLNFGTFDLDNNFRQTVIDNTNIKNLITEKQLKEFCFRFMFTKSVKQSLNFVNRYIQKNPDQNSIPLGILPYWNDLYDVIHNIVGDTSLMSKIFYYESILELRTVLALREQNYYTTNIYDCFYSTASPDIIKSELKKQSKILYDDFVNNQI